MVSTATFLSSTFLRDSHSVKGARSRTLDLRSPFWCRPVVQMQTLSRAGLYRSIYCDQRSVHRPTTYLSPADPIRKFDQCALLISAAPKSGLVVPNLSKDIARYHQLPLELATGDLLSGRKRHWASSACSTVHHIHQRLRPKEEQ